MSIATKIFLVSTTFIMASGNQEQCLVHSKNIDNVQLPVSISLKPESPEWKVELHFLSAPKTESLCVTLDNAAGMSSHFRSHCQSFTINFGEFTQEKWTYLEITRNCSHLLLHWLGRPEKSAYVLPKLNEPLYLQVKSPNAVSFTFNCRENMCTYEAKQPGYELQLFSNKDVFFKPDSSFKSLSFNAIENSPLGHLVGKRQEVKRQDLGGPPLAWVQVKTDSHTMKLITNSKVIKQFVVKFPELVIIDGSSFLSDCNPQQSSELYSQYKDNDETVCEETRATRLATPAATLTIQTTETQATNVTSDGSVIYVFLVIISVASVLVRVVLVAKAVIYYKRILATLNTAQDHDASSQRSIICLNIILKSCLVMLILCLCIMMFSLCLTLIIAHHLQVPNLTYIFIFICGSVCFLLHIFFGLRRIFSLVSHSRTTVQPGRRASQGVSSVKCSGCRTEPQHGSRQYTDITDMEGSGCRTEPQHGSRQYTDITDMEGSTSGDTDSFHEQLLCHTKLTQTVLKACLILLLLCLSNQIFSFYLVWKM